MSEEEELVRSLREVVGERCTDDDIRSVLVDCGMDPDDAVHRLLSLDAFRKVKSKRERRKETVGNNNGGVASEISDRGTAAQDIENQLTAPPEHGVEITGRELSPYSNSLNAFSASGNFFTGKIVSGVGSQVSCTKMAVITSSTAPDTRLSKAASTGGDSSYLSTVEAFREDEPQIRRPGQLVERSDTFQDGDQQKLSHFHPKLLHVSSSYVQPTHFSERQTTAVSSISSTPMASSMNFEQSHNSSTTQNHGVEEFQVSGQDTERNIFRSRSNLFTSSRLIAPQDESSAAAHLQQLSLRKPEHAAPRSNDDSSVVFPPSLQNLAADCSHINFGRLKLDKHGSGSVTFNSLKDNNQEATSDGLSSFPLDTRSSEYMDEYRHDYQLGSFSSERQLRTGVRNMSVPSQVQLNISELAAQHEHKGQFPVPDYHFKRFPDFSSPSVPVSWDARNLSPLYEESQARSKPVPAQPLTSIMEPVRHAEIRFPFPGHSASRDWGLSSAAAPANSISEVLSPGDFSLVHPHLEIPGTANLASRHVLPQDLSMKPQFTPAFPVEDSVNWNQSSVMPQSGGARGLSAFLQSYPHTGVFHDSQAFMNYGTREARPRSNASNYEGFSDSIILPRSIPIDSQYPRENNLGPLIGGPGSISSSRTTPSGSDGIQYGLYREPRQLIPRYEQSQRQYQDYSSLGYTNFALPQMRFTERQPQWSYNTPSSNSLATSKQQHKYSQLKF